MPNTFQHYWSEKYRPTKIDDMILSKTDKETMQAFLDKGEIPNLLLVGSPGTGKSTLGRILTLALSKVEENRLFINASDQRGIDVIRNKIIPFMGIPPYGEGVKIKVVMLDEADYLTPEAFAALRSAIEDPIVNSYLKTRFILTANFSNKIPAPIQSRMNVITYDQPSKEAIIERCKMILKFENVTSNDEVLTSIVERNYPDMRSIIGVLEMSVVNGTLVERYASTQFEQIKNIIRGMLTNEDVDEVFKLRGELIDTFSEDYSASEIIQWILDEFIMDPLITAIAFKYSTYATNCVDDKHLVLAMLSDIMLSKFAI